MPDAALSDAIKGKAAELGFALCGITDALPPPHHRHYARWLAEGKAGEMLYLHRQEPKRGDLRKSCPAPVRRLRRAELLAGKIARRAPNPGKVLTGTVARYARFDDYHETLWERLKPARLHSKN